MLLAPGHRLGPYEIVGLLGSGGMGEVYRTRDVRLGRHVALKILPPEIGADTERLVRFLSEARAASAVTHPSVARLYDVGEDGGVHYLVMELVEGISLQERLGRGELPIEEVLRIGMAVASALAEAHGCGVVHRDIKPANLMITSSGEVKILDFGVAKLQRSFSDTEGEDGPTLAMTEPGRMIGTLYYMSPEQALGREVDHRSDLFSVGVLLYEAATGRLPFRGQSAFEILDQILRVEPPLPSLLRADVSPTIEAVILRCIEKSRERRFQSAGDLLVELQRSQRVEATAADAKPSILVLPFQDISSAGDNEYFSDGLTEEIIASLSMIHSLAVVSRTSAMRLKGTDKGIRSLGREMDVRYVLEGSVRKAGNALRITAQLIDTTTDLHLWANTYKGTLEDVFEIQEMVATRIAEALKLDVGTRSGARKESSSRLLRIAPRVRSGCYGASSSVRSSGTPSKSAALRVRSTAPRATAVTPIAMSAARRRGEPKERKISAAFSANGSVKATMPRSPKKVRATASCSGVRGPRQNSYQATAEMAISAPRSTRLLSCCLSTPEMASAVTRKSVSRW